MADIDPNELSDRMTPTLRLRKAGKSLKSATLKVEEGPDAGKTYELSRYGAEIQIGSSGDNDIILQDPTVSRHHAVILQEEGGFLVKDLKSTNGSFINNVKFQEAYLRPTSELRFGQTKLVILSDEIAPAVESLKNRFGELRGSSHKMKEIFELLRRLSNSNMTVLITGETGTGKELAARAIHVESDRASRPFVVIDCGAIPENLMESELFGHEKGAFTGATAAHDGAFEQANGGTVFLDEVGELPLSLQPKLLRVLESLQVKRIGGNKTFKVDVRVLAATNRDLKADVKSGKFREDLFYRLGVFELSLPALREHLVDIPMLIEHFVEQKQERRLFTDSALKIMMNYSWPGNVRQLRNVVERILLLTDSETIEAAHLENLLPSSGRFDSTMSGRLVEAEKTAIERALRESNGNKSAAARKLGIAYSTLFEKLKKYGLS